eukprot:gnl/Dysnectes_brevis/789_a869_3934.p1 GENE.gnl/Dysnectes_brevis/789_a869_3934~~gnl/Dysnectes_brevis/789_a869_3934.p1  ORF type:complete len:348 (+),score=112.12 gnl/Dysnectes_brevis/789_a869_3934:26-1045(+)
MFSFLKPKTERLYRKALEAGSLGMYDVAITYLDECLEILASKYGTDVHHKLARFYSKIGKALFRSLTEPFVDEALLGEPGEGEDEEESCEPSGEEAKVLADEAAEEDKPDEEASLSSEEKPEDPEYISPEEDTELPTVGPYSTCRSYLDKALDCISTAPNKVRNSPATLELEADIYLTLGELGVYFHRDDAVDTLRSALALLLRLHHSSSLEVTGCRYYLGRALMVCGRFVDAVGELGTVLVRLREHEEELELTLSMKNGKKAEKFTEQMVLVSRQIQQTELLLNSADRFTKMEEADLDRLEQMVRPPRPESKEDEGSSSSDYEELQPSRKRVKTDSQE